MLNSTGRCIRQRGIVSNNIKNIWLKGVPFKVSFFVWTLWKKRLPIGEIILRWGSSQAISCSCYDNEELETFDHLFMHCPDSKIVWSFFAIGTNIEEPF